MEDLLRVPVPLLVVPSPVPTSQPVRKWRLEGRRWVRDDVMVPEGKPPSQEMTFSGGSEEDRILCQLAHRYEQRWPIIADRYLEHFPNMTANPHLPVVLQERFVKLQGREFDGNGEIERREQWLKQQGNPGEQQEEAFVARWMAKVWSNLPQTLITRQYLLQQHAGILATEQRLHGLTLAEMAGRPRPQILKHQDPNKPPLTAAQIAANEARRERRREQRRKQAAAQAEQKRLEQLPPTSDHTSSSLLRTPAGRKPSKVINPATLRSTTLPAIRVGLCRHVDKVMNELGLPPRPHLSTGPLIEAYAQLRQLIVELSELQKSLGLGSGSNSQFGSSHERISGVATPRPTDAINQNNNSPPVTRSLKRKRDSLK